VSLENLVFVGAAIQFIGGFSYIYLTLKGRVKPNRMTFFLWSAAPMIGTAAALVDGVGWAILPVFMAGFVPFLILLASFVNPAAYWKLSKFDYYCGAFSVLSLIFWWLTAEPLLAIFLAAAADSFAGLPTLRKAWQFPETESSFAYITAFIAVLLGLFAIEDWRPSEYIFSCAILAMAGSIVFAIHRRYLWKLIA